MGAEILVGHRWQSIPIQRNALFYRIPARVIAPKRLVLRERNGTTHAFVIRVCTEANIASFALPTSPLVAPTLC